LRHGFCRELFRRFLKKRNGKFIKELLERKDYFGIFSLLYWWNRAFTEGGRIYAKN